jgi:hypothetical protein
VADPLVGVDAPDEHPGAQLPGRRSREIDHRDGKKQHGDDEQRPSSP